MTISSHKNFAITTIATLPSPVLTGTSCVVAAGKGALFPTVPFNATVWPPNVQPTSVNAEIVRVTGRSTDTLTIVREQESTTAKAWLVGWQIAATITARTLTDVEKSAAATSWAGRFDAMGAQTVRPSYLQRIDADTLRMSRSLGGAFWMDCELSDGAVANGPYAWNETVIRERFSYILAHDAACTYSGAGWADLNSADPATYIGGRAKQTDTVANDTDYVEVAFTLDAPADIYVVYVGRSNGRYVKAVLDSAADGTDLLPSSTYRYIDTYNATDLTYKQFALVASGLGSGAHTLRLTAMTDINAGNVSGQLRFLFNALAISGGPHGTPGGVDTDAPAWVASTAYVLGNNVRVDGRYYACSVAGTSSTTAPSHTSSTATDGTVTWTYLAYSSYAARVQTLQAAGSQLEYAYQIKPSGAASFEDVGSLLHGNEELQTIRFATGGRILTELPIGGRLSGDSVQVIQTIKATHSHTGSTSVNQTTLTHTASSRGMRVDHEHRWQGTAEVGWFYAAMWPLLHWLVTATNGDEFRWMFDKAWTPQMGEVDPADYYGQSNPIVGRVRDYIAAAYGDVFQPNGAASVPSGTGGTHSALVYLSIDPASVNDYDDASNYFAALSMNTAAVTPPGYSSMVMKMYFERAAQSLPASVVSGDVWACGATYGVRLIPSGTLAPWESV